LAFAIAGHHAGLADAESLERRLGDDYAVEPYEGWQTHCGLLPALSALAPTRIVQQSPERGFTQAFVSRMLFSCLVDADFLETERFYSNVNDEPVERGGHRDLEDLRNRLRRHMATVRARAEPTPVNQLRSEVLEHSVARAGLSPGLFTLTVPTGGGKTLASLSFALEHAGKHGLRRVVYVIPFTSVIEQTAAVFRKALDSQTDILEHHASFDWERQSRFDPRPREGGDMTMAELEALPVVFRSTPP
jgi:CRISPR-associated endonuclease/helicase Cas3